VDRVGVPRANLLGPCASTSATAYASVRRLPKALAERAGCGARASIEELYEVGRLVKPRSKQATMARDDEPVAEVRGVNVHAKQKVDGRDRAQLERLCRSSPVRPSPKRAPHASRRRAARA